MNTFNKVGVLTKPATIWDAKFSGAMYQLIPTFNKSPDNANSHKFSTADYFKSDSDAFGSKAFYRNGH